MEELRKQNETLRTELTRVRAELEKAKQSGSSPVDGVKSPTGTGEELTLASLARLIAAQQGELVGKLDNLLDDDHGRGPPAVAVPLSETLTRMGDVGMSAQQVQEVSRHKPFPPHLGI